MLFLLCICHFSAVMVCSMRYAGPLPHGFHMISFQKTKLNEKKNNYIEKSPRNTKKKKQKTKQNNNNKKNKLKTRQNEHNKNMKQ